MTRLFTEGFELGDALGLNSLAVSGNYVGAASNEQARSGTYGFKISGGSTGGISGGISFVNETELYLRFGFYVSSYAISNGNYVSWWSGATIQGAMRLNGTSRCIEIYTGDGASLKITGTRSINLGQWYLIELHIKIDDATGSFDVKIDGIADGSFSGDTKPSSAVGIDTFSWFSYGNGMTCYIDDIAINNTNNADGLNDNSWCGDGKVLYIAANAAGDVTQLTASAGSNYQCVDDIPPNTTDYVSSNTADQYDLYNLSALTPALTAGQTILRVWPECRALEEAAAGDNIALGIKPSGGSEDWSSDLPVTSTYNRYVGKHYKTDPSDAGAWTEADVNALQAGVKVR